VNIVLDGKKDCKMKKRPKKFLYMNATPEQEIHLHELNHKKRKIEREIEELLQEELEEVRRQNAWEEYEEKKKHQKS
jgi:hypothetical protein